MYYYLSMKSTIKLFDLYLITHPNTKHSTQHTQKYNVRNTNLPTALYKRTLHISLSYFWPLVRQPNRKPPRQPPPTIPTSSYTAALHSVVLPKQRPSSPPAGHFHPPGRFPPSVNNILDVFSRLRLSPSTLGRMCAVCMYVIRAPRICGTCCELARYNVSRMPQTSFHIQLVRRWKWRICVELWRILRFRVDYEMG